MTIPTNDYNRDMCDLRHLHLADTLARIDERLERIETTLRGNGTPGVARRLERVETLVTRYETLAWRVIAPLIPLALAALVTGAAVLLHRVQ